MQADVSLFLSKKVQNFSVNHYISSPSTPCYFHFTLPLKGVNFKALESAQEMYRLYQSPLLLDWQKYSLLEYNKAITLKTDHHIPPAPVKMDFEHLDFLRLAFYIEVQW